jgi:hypothetical protein
LLSVTYIIHDNCYIKESFTLPEPYLYSIEVPLGLASSTSLGL